MKQSLNPGNFKNIREVEKTLTASEITQAKIEACLVIEGEARTYFDRYFGFEQKLEVMR